MLTKGTRRKRALRILDKRHFAQTRTQLDRIDHQRNVSASGETSDYAHNKGARKGRNLDNDEDRAESHVYNFMQSIVFAPARLLVGTVSKYLTVP